MRNNSLYKFVITSIILILALSVSGLGECRKPSPPYLFTASHTILYCSSTNVQRCAKYCDEEITLPSNYVKIGSFQSGICGGLNISSCGCQIGACSGYTQQKYNACVDGYICDTQVEADSMRCTLDPTLPICCDAHCECDKSGGTWHPNGYCVKDCQTEACCDSLNVPQVAYDSVYIWQNNTCALHWRCESPQAECVAINGLLVADVLPDTTTQDGATTITNKCYYNCGRIIPSDSSKSMVDGNIVLPSSVSLISQGIKTPNPFDAVRSEDNGEYTYDFLSPQAEHYLDSIAFTPCVQALYRCVLNGKYAYYYDNQTAPSGCTNIVKIK